MPLSNVARIARMRAEAEKIRAAQQAAARPAAAIDSIAGPAPTDVPEVVSIAAFVARDGSGSLTHCGCPAGINWCCLTPKPNGLNS